MSVKSFKTKGAWPPTKIKAGEIVYECKYYDYGLANDDTRATGIEHTSVTRKSSGDYPFVTIPVHLLEEI